MNLIGRRRFVLTATVFAGVSAIGVPFAAFAADEDSDLAFAKDPIRKLTDADWKRKLGNGLNYSVLRQEDTEERDTSPLLKENRNGTFRCRGCDLPLFESKWKYESRTGWPSFYDVIKQNVGLKVDKSVPTDIRTEYHCARCLGHQGHLFDDGPKPTGLRYCNNGASLTFKRA